MPKRLSCIALPKRIQYTTYFYIPAVHISLEQNLLETAQLTAATKGGYDPKAL